MNSDEVMIGWQEGQQQAKQQGSSFETTTMTLDSKAQGSKQVSTTSGDTASTTIATTTTPENASVVTTLAAATKVTQSKVDEKSTIVLKPIAKVATTITSTSSFMRQNDNIMTSSFNNNNNSNNNNNDRGKNSVASENESRIGEQNEQQRHASTSNSPKSSYNNPNNVCNNPDENVISSEEEGTNAKSTKNLAQTNEEALKSNDYSEITPGSSPDDQDRALMIANDDNVDHLEFANSNSRSPSSSTAAPSPSTTNITSVTTNSKLKTVTNCPSTTASSSAESKSNFTAVVERNSDSQDNSSSLVGTNHEFQADSIANSSEISVDTSMAHREDAKITSGDLSTNSDSTIALTSPNVSKQLQDSEILADPSAVTSPVSSNSNNILMTAGIMIPANGTTSSSNVIMNNSNSKESLIAIDGRDAEISAELRWTPGIPDCDLMMYLRAARSMAAFAGMCDGGTLSTDDFNPATRDDTTINALELLHKCDYDTSRALQALVKNPIPRSVDKKWSSDEQQRFIRAVNTRYPPKGEKKDKDFIRIRNEVLPHKKVSELVEFYYLFKKTSLFTGPKNNRKRRAAPSRLKPTKNLNNRENNLEVGECVSSDESGDASNENEDNGKKIQNNDNPCLIENASNSPPCGDDQLNDANTEPGEFPSSNNNNDNINSGNTSQLSKLKHEPRSPSIMQKSIKTDDSTKSKPELYHRIETDSLNKIESSIKEEPGTSSTAKQMKLGKEDEPATGGDSSTPDGSPRSSPQPPGVPDESIPKPTLFMNQSFSNNAHSPHKPIGESELSSLPDNQRCSPNQSANKPANLSTLSTGGCSSLAQFTDSIGQQHSPNLHRTSPGSNKQTQQSSAGQTSCASLAQLTEQIGQPSPNNNLSGIRPAQPPVPPNLSPNLSHIPGMPGLPPNMPFNLPCWNYGQPPRPGQPPLVLPQMFAGIPGFPGFPPINPINPPSSSPAKIPTPKSQSSSSSQQRSLQSTSSPVGGLHNQSSGPSPHQQSSSSMASPSTHANPSPNKIRTQNAILTRVIQRPDNITCARTDWTFKPQKVDVNSNLNVNSSMNANSYSKCPKKKSERDHSDSKRQATDRDVHHSSSQHQMHSHSHQHSQQQPQPAPPPPPPPPQQQLNHQSQPPMNHPGAPPHLLSNFLPQHPAQARDRDPSGPPPPGPPLPGLSDPSHPLHPFPGAVGLDRPQSSRFMDNPALGSYGFRNSPGDLTRPHTAFSPAGFPPRGTPTSLPSATPNFLPSPGLPPLPPAFEALFMQYAYNAERLNANSQAIDFDSHRRLLHSFQDSAAGGPPRSGTGGLPPHLLHNPGSPNPAALAGLMFPPGSDIRDQFSERLGQPDAFRLPMRPGPDLYQAYAAAMSQFGNSHDPSGGSNSSGPGGPGGLGLPPHPSHSQADGINFPAAPVRPMMPGRDQYYNPQRYASFGAPYGVPPSPFFGLGGPPAP